MRAVEKWTCEEAGNLNLMAFGYRLEGASMTTNELLMKDAKLFADAYREDNHQKGRQIAHSCFGYDAEEMARFCFEVAREIGTYDASQVALSVLCHHLEYKKNGYFL